MSFLDEADKTTCRYLQEVKTDRKRKVPAFERV